MNFQGITVDDAGFDRSIKQGEKESRSLFHMVMRSWPGPLRHGKIVDRATKHERIQRMGRRAALADNCYILASSRSVLAMFYLGQSYLGQFLLRPVLLRPGAT